MNQLELEEGNYLNALGQRINNAKHGEKGKLLKEASGFFNCSVHKVYNRLNELGLVKSRKTRSDKNTSKISKEECLKISGMLRASRRDSDKKLLPVSVAIDVLRANGDLRCDISDAHLGRMLKKHNVHPDQLNRPTPHTRQRSRHPNAVWEFDVSVCVLFYMKGSTGMNIMPKDEFYKNKPENIERIKKERVLRYLVTDHFSGTFYVEYFVTSGENSETLFHFLMNAFNKHHKEDPFYGVPFILKLDKGTANISHMIMNLLGLLGIEVITHEAGNPRAKGQVEKTHDIIECNFEGRLRFVKIDNVVQLNQHAHQWMRSFNSKKIHTRHKKPRYGLWQIIKKEELRFAPDREVCKRILQVKKPVMRPVNGDLSISFSIPGMGSLDYCVKDFELLNVGDKVTVWENPYTTPNVTIEFNNSEGEKKVYEVEPIERDAAGFDVNLPYIGEDFKSKPDTPADKQRKQLNLETYGVLTEKEVKDVRKKGAVAFDEKINPFADTKKDKPLQYMERKGHHMTVDAPHIETTVRLSWTTVGKRIVKQYGLKGAVMKSIGDGFKQRFPDGIPQDELPSYIQEVMSDRKASTKAG